MNSAATFDHVGISVADLEAAAGWYCAALGLTREFAFEVPPASLRGVMLLSDAGYRVELLERAGSAPAGPASGSWASSLRKGRRKACGSRTRHSHAPPFISSENRAAAASLSRRPSANGSLSL